MSKAYFKSPNRVCAYTFKNEKDLPPGQELFVCSKCMETCYISREAQKTHWPVHRATCCSLENDDEQVRRGLGLQTQEEWAKTLRSFREHNLQGRKILYCLQQLFQTFDDSPSQYYLLREQTNWVWMPFLVFLVSIDRPAVERLWSIPGFANFFLSEDIFMTRAVKALKSEGRVAPSQTLYETADEVALAYSNSSPEHQILLSPVKSQVICTLLLVAALEVSETQSFKFKAKPLSIAACRHIFHSWKCPFSRVSFPSVDSRVLVIRGRQFFGKVQIIYMILLGSFQLLVHHPTKCHKYLAKNEILAGLTVKEGAIALVSDDSFCRTIYNEEQLIYIFQSIFPGGRKMMLQDPWNLLSAIDRLELMNLIQAKSWEPPALPGVEDAQGNAWYWILGIRTSTILHIYELAIDQATVPTPHKEVTMMLRGVWDAFINKYLPPAQAYLSMVEPKYRASMESLGYEPLPFPEDVLELIVEFSLPNEYAFDLKV